MCFRCLSFLKFFFFFRKLAQNRVDYGRASFFPLLPSSLTNASRNTSSKQLSLRCRKIKGLSSLLLLFLFLSFLLWDTKCSFTAYSHLPHRWCGCDDVAILFVNGETNKDTSCFFPSRTALFYQVVCMSYWYTPTLSHVARRHQVPARRNHVGDM